jgi:hypothetical protein
VRLRCRRRLRCQGRSLARSSGSLRCASDDDDACTHPRRADAAADADSAAAAAARCAPFANRCANVLELRCARFLLNSALSIDLLQLLECAHRVLRVLYTRSLPTLTRARITIAAILL